jgi:hypothetical protein
MTFPKKLYSSFSINGTFYNIVAKLASKIFEKSLPLFFLTFTVSFHL